MQRKLDDCSWEPLPPRKSSRRNKDKLVIDKTSPGNETFEENIKARSNQVWAPHSLESNDGCASEFYEYLDHTADVQLHAWGKTLEDAFTNVIKCMFNFITDMNTVSVNKEKSIEFTVNGKITNNY